MPKPQTVSTLSPRRLAACRANIRKAHEANRRNPLSPARRAALRRATEANRKNYRLTPARLAAMRANGRKMQAASVRKFRMTPARRKAVRANLLKALAAPRTPESRARSRFNDLKHGLYARSMEETLALAGEDPKEFQGLERALAQAFTPRDEEERELVRAVVRAVWRRLRLYRAEARWEIDRMKMLLDWCATLKLPRYTLTQMQAQHVVEALLDQAKFWRYSTVLLAEVERALRALLRKRLGREPDFAVFTPEDLKEMEEPVPDKFLAKRLAWGDPEALKEIEEILPESWKK